MHNVVAFIEAVAGQWFFWVGIALRIEPYLEGAFPQVGNVIRRLLADGRRQKFFRAVGIVALLIAFFQAWNTQYEMVRQNDQRFAMKDLLGNVIVEGEAIVQSHKQSKEQADADTYQHDAEKWATKTDNLIEDAYGKGEAAVWASNAGLTSMNTVGYPTGLIRSWVINRLQRSNELMSRVDNLPLLPGFDPHNYHWRAE